MIICVCKSVTSKHIDEILAEGVHSKEEVVQRCGAGTDCGSCQFKLQKVLNMKSRLQENLEVTKAQAG